MHSGPLWMLETAYLCALIPLFHFRKLLISRGAENERQVKRTEAEEQVDLLPWITTQDVEW